MAQNPIREVAQIPRGCREQFLPLGLESASPLREAGVVIAGVSLLVEGFEMARVAPAFTVLVWTFEGGASWEGQDAGGEVTNGELGTGEFFLAPARSNYLYRAKKRWGVAWCHLENVRQGASGFASAGVAPCVRKSREGELFRLGAQGFLREIARGDGGLAALHFAELMRIAIARELENAPISPSQNGVLEPLWEKVAGDLGRAWTIEVLCREAGMSPSHLHRLSVSETGAAPLQTVSRLRLQEAARRLRSESCTLEQLARELGYGAPFALSRAFKRHFGRSPQSFRSKLGL